MLRVFRTENLMVVLFDPGQEKALLMHPQGALELARGLEAWLEPVRIGDVLIEADADGFALISPAGWCIRFPLDVGPLVARGLREKAREADELRQANSIIADNGILAWMGLPVGLSDNPRIKRESRKEAEKYLNREKRPPGGIEPRGIVGTPAIVNLGTTEGTESTEGT